MTKRTSITKQIAVVKAQGTRRWKSEKCAEVCKKDKVESADDICGIFYGLSRKAIEGAAFREIINLARLRYSPVEILERMEPSKK